MSEVHGDTGNHPGLKDQGRIGTSPCSRAAARSRLLAMTATPPPLLDHELNPVEPVWSHLKRSLANLTKHDLTELTALGEDPPQADAVPPRAADRLPRQHRARSRALPVTPAFEDL